MKIMTRILMVKAMIEPIQTSRSKIKYSGRTPKLKLKEVKLRNVIISPYFLIFDILSDSIILIAK